MATSPPMPKLLRGAIVGTDLFNPVASVILFQYNPHTLTRTLAAKTQGNESGARVETMRLSGAPIENIKLEIDIDATDQLEAGDGIAESLGIHPQLAALEMLLYPKAARIIINSALSAAGMLEVVPTEAPMTLFIWGIKRVLPVRLSGFTITEQAYDTALNPIRAQASLDMRVLSYNDFSFKHPGFSLFMAHQVVKEVMAVIGSVSNISAVAGGNVKLF